jgi:hypothetical protein
MDSNNFPHHKGELEEMGKKLSKEEGQGGQSPSPNEASGSSNGSGGGNSEGTLFLVEIWIV